MLLQGKNGFADGVDVTEILRRDVAGQASGDKSGDLLQGLLEPDDGFGVEYLVFPEGLDAHEVPTSVGTIPLHKHTLLDGGLAFVAGK